MRRSRYNRQGSIILPGTGSPVLTDSENELELLEEDTESEEDNVEVIQVDSDSENEENEITVRNENDI